MVGRQRCRRRKSTAVFRDSRNNHDSNTAGSRKIVNRRTILMNTIWTTSSTLLGWSRIGRTNAEMRTV